MSNDLTVSCSLKPVPNSFCRDKTKQVIPGDSVQVAISCAESQVVHCVNSQHILQQDKNVDLKCRPGAAIFNTTVCTWTSHWKILALMVGWKFSLSFHWYPKQLWGQSIGRGSDKPRVTEFRSRSWSLTRIYESRVVLVSVMERARGPTLMGRKQLIAKWKTHNVPYSDLRFNHKRVLSRQRLSLERRNYQNIKWIAFLLSHTPKCLLLGNPIHWIIYCSALSEPSTRGFWLAWTHTR